MFGKLKSLLCGAGIDIPSPVAGTVVPLAEVPDPTLAQGILGKGAAVVPSEGRITAPADGTVDLIFDTGHAVSLTTQDGVSLLIHIGVDTVRLAGAHFTVCCKAEDSVKAGDTLILFDPAAIQSAGYDTITSVIVCNTEAFAAVRPIRSGAVAAGDPLLHIDK